MVSSGVQRVAVAARHPEIICGVNPMFKQKAVGAQDGYPFALEQLESRRLLSATFTQILTSEAPSDVAYGSDHLLWFLPVGGGIDRLNADNSVSSFSVPSSGAWGGMTLGSDGISSLLSEIMARSAKSRPMVSSPSTACPQDTATA